VAVGANDFADPASVDRVDDGHVIMSWIEHHNFFVVSDDPNVVRHVEIFTVEGEDAVGGNQFNTHPNGLSHLSPPKDRKQRAK
jgi:hypothetical protein